MKPEFLLIVSAFLLVFASRPVEAAEPGYQVVVDRAKAIQIPQATFAGVPLSKALESLEALSKQHDADGIGLAIEFPGASKEDPEVTITLRNLSLFRVLDFVTQSVGYDWTVRDGKVSVFKAVPSASQRFQFERALPADHFAAPSGGSRSRTRSEMLQQVSRSWQRPAVYSLEAPEQEFNTEAYDLIENTGFRSPRAAPLSTFSIDVDTASYANVRRFLDQGKLPPANAVRLEELINYFPYDYDGPPAKEAADPDRATIRDWAEHPFAVNVAVGPAPWSDGNSLVRIGLQGFEIDWEDRPPANLIFLLDVSGSMNSPDKLPLVVDSMRQLTERLDGRDRVAIVVYAGASGLVLPSTTANNQETIRHALEQLRAGGSTNAGEGIELAYAQARQNFIEDGANRVILCTDGDFNVGVTDRGQLIELVREHAGEGVFLTVLGFGGGNLKDSMLEELSNQGNGNYGYIDSKAEARKMFFREISGSLLTIAKDVKIQVEFNPAQVKAYRLIGYENRRLNDEDFNDDTVDAGELGAGHSVTALYEIVPPTSDASIPEVDDLKYQDYTIPEEIADELLTIKLRYKWPDSDESQLLETAVVAREGDFASMPDDFRFAAAVAGWGMLLRDSEFKGAADLDWVKATAESALSHDSGGFRSGFLELVDQSGPLLAARENASENNEKGKP